MSHNGSETASLLAGDCVAVLYQIGKHHRRTHRWVSYEAGVVSYLREGEDCARLSDKLAEYRGIVRARSGENCGRRGEGESGLQS